MASASAWSASAYSRAIEVKLVPRLGLAHLARYAFRARAKRKAALIISISSEGFWGEGMTVIRLSVSGLYSINPN